MKERNYERPRILLLDAGSNYGYGACAAGGLNTCGAGTGIGSTGGGQCLSTGQYAGSCSEGSSQGIIYCKSGAKTGQRVNGNHATRPFCTSGTQGT